MWEFRVPLVIRVSGEPQELVDLQERQVVPDHQELQETLVLRDLKDPLVQQDHRELKEVKVHKVNRVLTVIRV